MNMSVVIPSYNEEQNIKVTIEELLRIIKNISDIDNFQIIVVDDSSSDNTFDIVKNMNDPRVCCIRLSRHSGSHTALRAGLQESKADATLFISADGQDDPAIIADMLNIWQRGFQIVWALRRNRKTEPWYIRKSSELFYKILFLILNAKDNKIDLSRAAFFLLDRAVVDVVNACPERNTSLFGLIMWLGFKQGYVEYDRRKRISGVSRWTFTNRYHLVKDWIIAFSGLPLKIVSLAGILISLIGVLFAIYIIIEKLIFSNILPGWTSIIVTILILGGIQLVMLGIIGEYLWRNLDESRRRPLYFIESKTQSDSKKF